MERKTSRIVRSLLCSLVLAAFPVGQPARAGGVHDIPLTSVPAARDPIVIDGNLTDWPDTHPVVFVPLDPGLVKPGSPSEAKTLAALRRDPPSIALQACYDPKALYVGVVWHGAAQGAGALTIHVATDRIAHVRIAPGAAGQTAALQGRISVSGPWRPLGAGARAAVAAHSGTATEEIRIPWTALTVSGTAPAKVTLAADFEWPQLTPAFLRALPTQVRHDNTHLTACFLTSPDKLFGRDAYLGDPGEWGALKFVAGPRGNATQTSPLATGATETFVPQVTVPPTLDGRLAGWNPAQFQTVTYAPGLIGDRYSANLAASYDANNLYIAAHVTSWGGPLNTEPEATQAGFAGGDCLQIRLNDGPRTVNLCGWYDSGAQRAALTADGADLKDPFLLQQGAKEAFRTDPDGRGYTQVIALPWRVLPSGTAPQAGDVWRGTFQVWWAGLDPQFTALAQASLASGGGIAYPYHLPAEANVTVSVFDAQGHLVRALAKDAHRRVGRNTEYWDGKDQFGKIVAPGRYLVRGLWHPPISTVPVVSMGNPGSPPWPTADGRGDWLSDEAAPQGAVTDGTNVYLAAPGSEKGNSIIAVGPDGKRLWGHQESIYCRSVSLAVAGPYLYALYSGPQTVNATGGGPSIVGRALIVCLDKITGAPALFSTQNTDFQIATWPFVDALTGLWDMRADKTFTPAAYGGQPRYFANDLGEPTEAIGIAAAGGRLYVSMFTQNRLLVLDAVTGKQLGALPVPQPVGLAGLPDGRLLGVSGGKVVMIDPAAKTVATVIDHDLAAPYGVATDKAGNVYVSDWGASFQVKVFSPSGTLLRAIGTPGGRPWIGKWDASGMLLPRGMAVTDDGKLWVAEDDAAPNRVSVWNAATGAFLRDYIGPAPYGGGAFFWANPQDPSTVVAEGTTFHVDYAKKTWTPLGTAYRRMSQDQAFTPNGMAGMPGTRTIVHNGKQYVYLSNGAYQLVVFRRDGLQMTPVAAIGSLGRYTARDGSSAHIWDSDIGTREVAHYYPDFFHPHLGDNYVWTDTNGDGAVQPDEMQWVHSLSRSDTYQPGMTAEICTDWGFGVGPDGTVYVGGQMNGSTMVSRLDLQGWTPGGAPIYDMAAAHAIVEGSDPGGVHGLYADDQGHVLVTRNYEWNPGKHDALDCYDRNGTLLWSFYAPEGRQQTDDFLADNVIGEFHEPGGEDVLASWLWHANFKPYLFTTDGLYIASLLDDTKIGPTATWDESYKNYFQSPNGAAYIVNGANDAYHIDRITGLDQIHRFAGAISVSKADLAAAVTASAQAAALPPVAPPVIRVAWMSAPPALDGDLGDWDLSSAVTLRGSKNRTARVALGRDSSNLYLAYDVHGATMVNRGGNWQTLFISGDCDDLMLHVGPYQTHYAPAEGDERLLLSVYQGRPVAVLYRPVVPGSVSSVRLMSATVDQIVRIPSARISYQRTSDGYTLEASVPLAAIGIDPTATESLHGDVGVIYADETGADRALRLYYYNHDTEMTADLTTEATLQPGNWGTVDVALGPNLLKNGDFEQPLAGDITQGWVVSGIRNGGSAAIASLGYSGGHSLLMQQTAPVMFTPDSYTLLDYDAFIHAANGGQGGGYTEVSQQVPVTPGKKYTLRFHFRTLDFPGGENKNPGPNRGYVSLQSWIDWIGAPGGVWVVNHQDTTPDWTTLMDAKFNDYGPPTPYVAPPGASAAIIKLNLSDDYAQRLPQAYIDDVEFVEAP